MNDYIHEICLLLICSIFATTQTGNTFTIVGMLLSIVVVCAQSFNQRILRVLALAIFTIASCFSIGLLSFLPLVAYASMHDRSWGIRLIWLFPICLHILIGNMSLPESSASLTALPAYVLSTSIDWATSQQLIWIVALCAIGCALGIKDVRRESEYKGLQRAYDLLKGQTLATLADINKAKTSGDADRQTTSAKTPRTAAAIASTPEDTAYQSSFFEGLTERELAVVSLVAEGMDNREISQKLFLSEGTVRNHISSILSKKDLHNRTQIAVMYYRG